MFEPYEVGASVDRETFEAEVAALRVTLVNAQFDLRRADFPVLVLLAGDDFQGVEEVLDTLYEWMDARYLESHVFLRPSDEERERPRFWRYWRVLPARGEVGIHVGAWAVRAVADHVAGHRGDEGHAARVAHVRRFEQTLVDAGTELVKIWIHLPRKEHKRRLKRAKKHPERERVPEEAWRVYERYGKATKAAAAFLHETDTAEAPWLVVEGTDDRHRDLRVGRAIARALTRRLEDGARPPPRVAPAPPAPDVLSTLDLSAALPYEVYRERREALQGRLWSLQRRAREAGLSSVLVFEGWDAAGKGGCIRRITRAVEARDLRVVPVGAPSEEERARHYLWRFWRRLPRAGRMLIFDRSWYGRVLVERVEGLAPEDAWRRAYAEINDFELQLAEHGMPVLKFWLHLDEAEQARRFEARARTPYKKYKLTPDDHRNAARRPDYERAANDMVARTHTPWAPWHLVAANDKRHARIRVLEETCRALEEALEG